MAKKIVSRKAPVKKHKPNWPPRFSCKDVFIVGVSFIHDPLFVPFSEETDKKKLKEK
jgi:hypothetical protein